MNFEWDENKNQINTLKHFLSFELASEIFNDPNLLTIIDNRVDYKEIRKINIGSITKDEIIVVVVSTDRNKKIRIISARKANKKEREYYLNNSL